ncbi:PD-(D/E)XK nuclease family protein [Sulfurimonas sp. SAG-AH-194-C21]|nr:PD-(D/E)XK nuclease family protein [Sulfurimonas sp. SAG-AH-194-C21]MDF1884474.1 PD-(D/E)XK nuclease family protein [Sulfurimonas sp. SAG-AH-194-C21]
MSTLTKNLYITYSNQKARDLKSSSTLDALDKVITLESLILELFESNNFEIIIDENIASSIIYNIIQDKKISYFDYLESDAVSLSTIFNFILKCQRNRVAFSTFVSDEKLNAITEINEHYQTYKRDNSLVDIADIEDKVVQNWDEYFSNNYSEVFIDSFTIENVSYIKSALQKELLEKLSIYKTLTPNAETTVTPKIIKPSNTVFDNIDEVKTAIRIARKLLEDGESAQEILIVSSDIQEYAPLYKLFLDEYEMKGFTSIGTPLTSFFNSNNNKVTIALSQYKREVKELEYLYQRLRLILSDTTKENLKSSITILDEKIGIEMTEPNQLVGLSKKYKHIIFIGTDINHFPPKASDNFLYSYDNELEYFYANNYFTSSQTQLNELKRLCENLYIITASYSGKRELTPSILIDSEFDETIDISSVKSVSQLALQSQTITPDTQTQEYYESITSDKFTKFDGLGVDGVTATHLSASQINKYISCPLAYLYSNKIKLTAPSQDEEGFDVMEQGSLMHLCYEFFGRYIKGNHIKSVDKDELFKIMFDVSTEAYNHKETREPKYKEPMKENIHHQIFLSTLQAGLQDERALGLLAKFVEYYIDNAVEFEYFQNSEFEKEFALDSKLQPYTLTDENDKNYFIKGFIDRFDDLEKHINIIDYKSKKMKFVIDKEKMEQIRELKDVQLALYILYASQAYSDKEYYASLLSFKGDRPSFHFANLANVEDVKDTEHYSVEYADKLKQLIFDTKANIENGEFGFDNSDEKMCGWCDIKHLCHEGVLSKNKSGGLR